MRKQGNIEIIFLLFVTVILIILSFSLYMLYTQIVTYIIPIKQDLFYIVQNSYFSLNQNDLEYSTYYIDSNKLRDKVNDILNINYDNCKLKNIYYNYDKNKVFIEINVNIVPVVFKNKIGNFNITIKDEIKLKTMEVK